MAGSFAAIQKGIDRYWAPFWQWWSRELVQAFAPMGRHLVAVRPIVVLSLAPDGVTALEDKNGHATPLLDGQKFVGVAAALAALGPTLRSKNCVLRVTLADCFVRAVELPAAARYDAGSILALDLFRTTPLQRREVMTAAWVEGPSTPGRILVRQLAVKRKLIEPALAACNAMGAGPIRIDCWSTDGRTALPIDFLALEAKPEKRGPLWPLPAAIALLIASSIAIEFWRQHEAIAVLDRQIVAAKAEATRAGAALASSDAARDEVAQLIQLRIEMVPRTAVLEELSRILPDDVWLSDLRIDDEGIEMSGFAPSGVAVVGLVEQARLMREAALGAPVTYDPREQRERFTVRASLVAADRTRRAAGSTPR